MRPSAPGCTATAAAARRAAATLRPLSRPALRRLRVTTAPSPSLSRPLSQLQKRIPLSGQVVALPSSRCVRPRRAQYHSHDHPKPSSPFSEAESTILAAAHARVPEYGFSAEALALGARDAGYLDISAGVVPDGAFGLVRWHLVTRREALAARAQELFGAASENGRPLSMTQKVEALVWERLMGNKEVVGRWQEALAIMAQPSYVPTSLKELAMLSDEIWFLAGDVAVDPSWYTKRASLSAIYATTELFMTNDHSPDFEETRQFLARRFSEAKDLGGAVRSISQWLGFTANAGINVLRSKGMPV